MYTVRHIVVILLSVIALTIPASTLASVVEEPQIDQEPGVLPVSLLSMTPDQALKLNPMDQEIRQLLIKERADVAALTELMKSTHDNMSALQIQKEIGVKKQQAELGIMEVQAKYAAQAGRHEQAAAIREAVAGMKERLAVALGDSGEEE